MKVLLRPQFWLGIGVSAGALALALRDLDFSEVADALATANYLLLVPALAVFGFVQYIRAVRWGLLFYPMRGLRLGNLFGTMNVGYLVNGVLPLRVGELARAYMVGEVEGVSKAHALSTILVERLVDVLVVVLLLVCLLPLVDVPGWLWGSAVGLGVAVTVLAVLLAGVSVARIRALALVRRLASLAPGRFGKALEGMAESAIQGFEVLARPGVLGRVVALTLVVWLLSALMMYFGLLAFDLNLSFTVPLFLIVATALGMVVPSSPGYVGVFHAIVIESLVNVFGIDRDPAASYALMQHLVFYLPPILIGLVYLWKEHTSWRSLTAWALRREAAERDVAKPAL